MSHSNSLELAKKGDADAIAALINQSLHSKNISVTATVAVGCLTLVAEGPETPDQEKLIGIIKPGLLNLNPASISRVVVQGKISGTKTPVWRDAFNLPNTPAISARSTPEKKPLSVITQKKESSSSGSSVLNTAQALASILNTLLLAGILSTLIWSSRGTNETDPVLWEYKVEGIEDLSFEDVMQQRGAEGWEMAFARRALAGDDDNSRGLYEVILKRPISPNQAQQNLANLELEQKQAEGENVIKAINMTQRLHHLNRNMLANSLTALDMDINPDGINYIFSMSLESSTKAIVTATAKTDELKSYIGAVAIQGGETKSIVCATNEPSKTPPLSPQMSGTALQCPNGSSEL